MKHLAQLAGTALALGKQGHGMRGQLVLDGLQRPGITPALLEEHVSLRDGAGASGHDLAVSFPSSFAFHICLTDCRAIVLFLLRFPVLSNI